MSRYDGETWTSLTVDDGLVHNYVRDVYQDREGLIWVATRRGVSRFDGEQWTTLTMADGLSSNEVEQIMQDREGHFWFATNGGGVSHFDGELWASVTSREGLASDGVIGMLQDRDGFFWFATDRGVTRLPAPYSAPPQVFIDAVIVDSRHEGVSELSVSAGSGIVAFEFSGVSRQGKPDKIRYRYRLKGYDDRWQITQDRRVEYPKLQRGAYTFEVIAVDQNLVQSRAPASVDLDVHLADVWVVGFIALGLLGVVITVQTVRVFQRESTLRSLHKELQESHNELERRVEERTVELTGRTVELAQLNDNLQQEIDERSRAEVARMQAEAELESQRALSLRADRLRSLGEMAAGMAHELNQPLMGVRGLAEHILIALERGWEITGDKLRERGQLIVEQADRMVHIIDHVRMFARESGKPEFVPVGLNRVVEAGVEMVGAQFRSHGIELKRELAEGLPSVHANPFSLEEVVINLLNNARDAVESRPEEGYQGTVVIRTSVNGSSAVKLEVVDNGIGISADVAPRIFDPFYTTKDPDRGTGLGLSVSKAILEEAGGQIELSSVPGGGTTFTILLPADPPPSPDEASH